MKPTSLALCVLLFVATSWVSVDGLECPAAGAHCAAWSSLKFYIAGSGKCWGKAAASCQSLAISDSCFHHESWKYTQECPAETRIRSYARCYAKALAAVYSTAYVKISCTGKGAGCGYAQSNGNAWACAFAAAFADSVINLGGDKVTCSSHTGALAAVFAKAAAKSHAKTCGKGNFVNTSFDSDFALAVQDAVVTAIATCYTKCDRHDPTKTEAEAEGEASADQSSTTVEYGDDTDVYTGDPGFPWGAISGFGRR